MGCARSLVMLSLVARAASADPCITPGTNPVMMAIGGGKASYCFKLDDVKLSCFAIDVATGAIAPAASPAPLGRHWPRLAPAGPRVKFKNVETGKKPRLCRPDGSRCKTLTMTHDIDQGMGLVDAENAGLTLAALSTLQWIDTFDLRTGKRIASFDTGAARSSCNSLDFAGDTLVVGEVPCGGDGMTAWLATAAGVKLADVGGSSPIHLGFQSIAKARGDNYAFSTLAGDSVIYQDVKTGKVVKRIPVGTPVADTSAHLLGNGNKLVLVYGGARAGDIAVIDIASNKVSRYPASRCPQ